MYLDEGKSGDKGLKTEAGGHTYYFCSEQCKRKFDANPTPYLAKSAPDQGGHAAASETQPKDEGAEDPVYGLKVDEVKAREAGLTAEYQGKVYYFCSDNSKRRFTKAPQLFSQKSPGSQDPAEAPIKPAVSIDAVCGTNVREKLSSTPLPKTEYKGTIYYFCSEQCKEAFNKEPERYLTQSAGSQGPGPSLRQGRPFPKRQLLNIL